MLFPVPSEVSHGCIGCRQRGKGAQSSGPAPTDQEKSGGSKPREQEPRQSHLPRAARAATGPQEVAQVPQTLLRCPLLGHGQRPG